MSSSTTDVERPKPQQERSSRRVAEYLETAANLFAEVGYDAATMTEIAERTGSSIGGLYRYFPDKQALALALKAHYAADSEMLWESVLNESTDLSIAELASHLVDRIADFVAERPAYFTVLAAPVAFQRDAAARRLTRTHFSDIFLAKAPGLSREEALLITNVVIQIIKGMLTVCSEVDSKRRPSVIREFKRALTSYLKDVLRKG